MVRGASQSSLLQIFVLGRFALEWRGHLVPSAFWQKRKAARSLVKLLAIEPTHQLHREQIIELLWPGVGLASGLNSFAKALHAARHALASGEPGNRPPWCLQLRSGSLVLERDRVWIDADEFRLKAHDALTSIDASAYDSAIALYGGDLLPEDRYSEWVVQPRQELQQLYVRLLESQAAIFEARQEYGTAVERLKRVLRIDPDKESVHRQLMSLYWSTGNRLDALREYRDLAQMLQQEFGTDPDIGTQQLYAEILRATKPAPDVLEKGQQATNRPSVRILRADRARVGPMLSREHPMHFLMGALSRAAVAAGSLVFVGGEDGVGKTRLLEDVARNAHQQGAATLWGTADDSQQASPYGVFTDALESYIGQLPHDQQRALTASRSSLAFMLPRIAGASLASRQTTPAPIRNRSRLHTEIQQLLSQISEGRPLLLILDDFHHADTESLELLHQLALIAPRQRWLFVAAYVDQGGGLSTAFQQFASKAVRAGLAQRVELQRLNRRQSYRLIESLLPGGPVGHGALNRLFDLSRGNPLYLHELIRDLQERGRLLLIEGVWHVSGSDSDVVSERVADLLLRRVDRLSNKARHLLDLLAVGSGEMSSSTLRSACALVFGTDLAGDELHDNLRTMCAEGDVHELDGRYALQTPILRAALYRRLSDSLRKRIHAALAQVVEQTEPRSVEALARHFTVGGNLTKALTYIERAADRARDLYASEAAAGHYREVVTRLQGLGNSLDAARVQLKLGGVLITLAQYDAAVRILSQAADTYYRTADLEKAGEAVSGIGIAHYYRGTPEDGIVQLEQMLIELENRGPSKAVATVAVGLVHLYYGAARYQDALSTADRAMQLASMIDDKATYAEALVDRGIVLLQLGRLYESRQTLEQAIPLVEAFGDLAFVSAALNNVARTHMLVGNNEQSVEFVERAIDVAEQIGDPARIAFMRYRTGVAAYFAGDRDLARICFEQAISMGDGLGDYWAAAYPVLALGRLCLDDGAEDEAGYYVRLLTEIVRKRGNVSPLIGPHSLVTEEALRLGRGWEVGGRLEAIEEAIAADSSVESVLLENAVRKLLYQRLNS